MMRLSGFVGVFSVFVGVVGCATPENANLGSGAAAASGAAGTGAVSGGTGGADAGAYAAPNGGSGGTAGSFGGSGGSSGASFGGSGGSFGGSGGSFGGSGGSAFGGAGGATQGGGPEDSCPGVALTLAGSGTDPRAGSTSGSTTGLADGTDGSCTFDYGGSDAVYSFTSDLAGIAHVKATADFDVALYVRTTCDMYASEVACADSYGLSDEVTFSVDASTTYYVVVDGSSTYDYGTFQLDVSVTQPGPDSSCPGQAVSFTGSGTEDRTASASGDTGADADSASATCTGSGQNDAVYAFTPDIDGAMTVALSDPGFDGGLYVRTTCDDSGSQVVCSDANGLGKKESVTFKVTAGTTYYVFVDGYDSPLAGSQSGPFTLDAKVVPVAADDACPGESAVWSGSAPETFSATGDTSARWDDATGSCVSGASADVVYAVTADHDGKLDLTLAPTGYDAAMYVRTTCDGAGSELACVDDQGVGKAEHYELWATAGTTYYVFADGSSAGETGAFKLDAALAPMTDEEKCPGATLTLAGTPAAASASGDLAQRWADYTGSCGSNTQARDAVYHVVAPQTGKLTVSLAPTGFDAVLYVRTDCLSSGAELTCQDQAGSGGTETAVIDAVAGTDYFIFVDSRNTTNGNYSLTASY